MIFTPLLVPRRSAPASIIASAVARSRMPPAALTLGSLRGEDGVLDASGDRLGEIWHAKLL
jgi:hypothetical protein